jgi:hypothetical protein
MHISSKFLKNKDHSCNSHRARETFPCKFPCRSFEIRNSALAVSP